MKKAMKKITILTFIFVMIFTLTGCGNTLTTSTYTDEKQDVKISLSYPEKSDCNFSTNENDFRTSAENAIWIFGDFKIAICIIDNNFDGDFEKIKTESLSKEDGKEVTFNKISGVSYYYSPYNRYNVKLPVNQKCYLELHIYPNDPKYDKDIASETFSSQDVQEVLNTIKVDEN